MPRTAWFAVVAASLTLLIVDRLAGPLAGLAVAVGIGWWLWPGRARGSSRTPFAGARERAASGRAAPESPAAPDDLDDPAGIPVTLRLATPALQQWISDRTGRAFEVTPANGVPGAQPGARGRATVDGATVRVRPLPAETAPEPEAEPSEAPGR